MGGECGPGVSRHIEIPNMDLEFTSNNTELVKRINKNYLLAPFEVYSVPEEIKMDIYTMNNALVDLENAQKRYDEALKTFQVSKAGNWINSKLNPDPELTLEDLMKNINLDAVRKALEKFGDVDSIVPSKHGYGLLKLHVKFNKNRYPFEKDLNNFNTEGFKLQCMNMEYEYDYDSQTNQIIECYLNNNIKGYYPPSVSEDYDQVQKSQYFEKGTNIVKLNSTTNSDLTQTFREQQMLASSIVPSS